MSAACAGLLALLLGGCATAPVAGPGTRAGTDDPGPTAPVRIDAAAQRRLDANGTDAGMAARV
ncbi:MAG TPA: hypothetical protein VLK29_10085, partial [Luteimonas sp.]|nr:hypothetical protein [Luteimonas sp.]